MSSQEVRDSVHTDVDVRLLFADMLAKLRLHEQRTPSEPELTR